MSIYISLNGDEIIEEDFVMLKESIMTKMIQSNVNSKSPPPPPPPSSPSHHPHHNERQCTYSDPKCCCKHDEFSEYCHRRSGDNEGDISHYPRSQELSPGISPLQYSEQFNSDQCPHYFAIEDSVDDEGDSVDSPDEFPRVKVKSDLADQHDDPPRHDSVRSQESIVSSTDRQTLSNTGKQVQPDRSWKTKDDNIGYGCNISPCRIRNKKNMSESHIGCQDMSPLNVALIVETTENFMEGLDIVEDSSEDNMLTPASDLRCSATSSSIYINHTLPDCQSQGPQEQLTQGRECTQPECSDSASTHDDHSTSTGVPVEGSSLNEHDFKTERLSDLVSGLDSQIMALCLSLESLFSCRTLSTKNDLSNGMTSSLHGSADNAASSGSSFNELFYDCCENVRSLTNHGNQEQPHVNENHVPDSDNVLQNVISQNVRSASDVPEHTESKIPRVNELPGTSRLVKSKLDDCKLSHLNEPPPPPSPLPQSPPLLSSSSPPPPPSPAHFRKMLRQASPCLQQETREHVKPIQTFRCSDQHDGQHERSQREKTNVKVTKTNSLPILPLITSRFAGRTAVQLWVDAGGTCQSPLTPPSAQKNEDQGGQPGTRGREDRAQVIQQCDGLKYLWNTHKLQLKDLLASNERDTAHVKRLEHALTGARQLITSLRRQRRCLHQYLERKENEWAEALRCHRSEAAFLRRKVLTDLEERKHILADPKHDGRLASILDSLLALHVEREHFLALDLAKQGKIQELKLLAVRQQLELEEMKEVNDDLNHALTTLLQGSQASGTSVHTSRVLSVPQPRATMEVSDVLYCDRSTFLPNHSTSPELATVTVFGVGGQQALNTGGNEEIFDASRQRCHADGDNPVNAFTSYNDLAEEMLRELTLSGPGSTEFTLSESG